MANDNPTTDQLIEGAQGLVRSIALKIHSKSQPQVSLDDLIAYGQLGLAQAAKSFCPDRKVSFSTYSYYRIRGAIYDGLSKMNWTTPAATQRIQFEQNAADVLESDAEKSSIARDKNESAESSITDESDWLVATTKRLAVVYLATRSSSGADLAQTVTDDLAPPDEQVADQEISDCLGKLVSSLPKPERDLIQMAYYEGLSLTEIAEKFGKSKSWASRLHSRTLDQLAQALTSLGAA